MSSEVIVTVALSICGAAASWCVWVSVSIFKHAQEIALMKQEIKLMEEIKLVLTDIRSQLDINSAKEK